MKLSRVEQSYLPMLRGNLFNKDLNPPLARLIKKSFNRRKAQNSAMFHGSWKLTFRALYNGIAYGIFGRVE